MVKCLFGLVPNFKKEMRKASHGINKHQGKKQKQFIRPMRACKEFPKVFVCKCSTPWFLRYLLLKVEPIVQDVQWCVLVTYMLWTHLSSVVGGDLAVLGSSTCPVFLPKETRASKRGGSWGRGVEQL